MVAHATIYENQWAVLANVLDAPVSASVLRDCLRAVDVGNEVIKAYLGLRAFPFHIQNVDGNVSFKASGICGMLNLFGRQINVAPKFVQSVSSAHEWQRSVLVMLGRARKRHFSYQRSRHLSLQNATFLDHVALAYADALTRAFNQEAIRVYRTQEETSKHVRGRISIIRQIKTLFHHPDRIECDVDNLDTDNQYNHLLHWAGDRFATLVYDSTVRKELAASVELLPEVTGHPRIPEHLPLSPPRQYAHFAEALEIASTLARGYSHGQRRGVHSGYGYILNMERLFESFVEATLRHLIASSLLSGFTVVAQDSQMYARPVQAGGKLYFTRPDNVLYADAQPVLLIDAKYKKFSESETTGPKPQNADLYQILASSVSRGCTRGLLVYPRLDDDSELRAGHVKRWSARVFGNEFNFGAVAIDLSRLGTQSKLTDFDTQLAAEIRMFLA